MRSQPPTARALACLLLALGVAAPLRAAVLTVGPGGAFGDLQSALDAAVASPEPDEIRVAAGTFPTNVRGEVAGRQVTISGGWRPGFTSFDRRQRTILHGGDLAPVITAHVHSGGALVLRRLELAFGHATWGGGLNVLVENGRLEITECVVRDNIAELIGAPALGGGAFVFMRRGGTFVLRGSQIRRNTVKGYPAHAAGMAVIAGVDGAGNAVTIERTSFVDNVASGDLGNTAGVGLLIDAEGTAVRLFDTLFRGNRRFGSGGYTAGAALSLYTGAGSSGEVRRLRAVDQQATEAANAEQVSLIATDGAQLVLGDSEVGRSAMGGIRGVVAGDSRLRLVNLTVADNRGRYGIHLLHEGPPSGPPRMSVANSIVFANATALRFDGPVTAVRNLVGRNPAFVNRAAADYRLRNNSPARDAGTGNPPGGLGPLDVARRPRVRGGAVDQGANEVQ